MSDDITLKESQALCEFAYDLRDKKKKKEEELEIIHAQIQDVQAKLYAVMETYELPNLRCSRGLISRREYYAFDRPQAEKEEEFKAELKRLGLYDAVYKTSANPKTMNSVLNAQIQAAALGGESITGFKGLEPPRLIKQLSFRVK